MPIKLSRLCSSAQWQPSLPLLPHCGCVLTTGHISTRRDRRLLQPREGLSLAHLKLGWCPSVNNPLWPGKGVIQLAWLRWDTDLWNNHYGQWGGNEKKMTKPIQTTRLFWGEGITQKVGMSSLGHSEPIVTVIQGQWMVCHFSFLLIKKCFCIS